MADDVDLDTVRIASMLALARALGAMGGYATLDQAYDWIAENTNLLSRTPARTKLSRSDHFKREVRFARQELADAGLLVSTLGAWQLLNADAADLTAHEARGIAQENTRQRRAKRAEPNLAQVVAFLSPAATKPTTGPRPVVWERLVKREEGPASVYLFRFANSNLWKIGFAADVQTRLREVNRHIPVELLGQRWALVRTIACPSSDIAYRLEQSLLRILSAKRTVYERVQCSDPVVDEAWQRALSEVSSAA